MPYDSKKLIFLVTALICMAGCANSGDGDNNQEYNESVVYDSIWRKNDTLSFSNIIDNYLTHLPKIDGFVKKDKYEYDILEDTIVDFLSTEDKYLENEHGKVGVPKEYIQLLDRKIVHPTFGTIILEGTDSYANSGLASCNSNGPIIVFSSRSSVYSSFLVFLFLREHEFAHHILGHINCPADLESSPSDEFEADALAVANLLEVVGDEYLKEICVFTISTFIAKAKESNRARNPTLTERACAIAQLIDKPYMCREANMVAISKMLEGRNGEIVGSEENPKLFNFTFEKSLFNASLSIAVVDSVSGIQAIDSIFNYVDLQYNEANYSFSDTILLRRNEN